MAKHRTHSIAFKRHAGARVRALVLLCMLAYYVEWHIVAPHRARTIERIAQRQHGHRSERVVRTAQPRPHDSR